MEPKNEAKVLLEINETKLLANTEDIPFKEINKIKIINPELLLSPFVSYHGV